jgi:hypothetical protein
MGTPAFRRARSAVELRQLLAAPEAAPTASRQFRRTDRVFVSALLSAPLPAGAATVAELLNKAGQRLVELAAAREPGRLAMELPVASLAPSRYILRLRVTTGDRQVEQLAAFDVVP